MKFIDTFNKIIVNRKREKFFRVLYPAFGVLLLAFFVPFGGLHAQVSCEGSACQNLSFFDNLNTMHSEFKDQYAQTMFDDLAEAATLANIMGIPGSTINLTGFTAGIMMNTGYVEAHDVQVNITGVGTMDNIPSAGGAVVPGAFIGINLGRILGMEPYDPSDPDSDTPSLISPRRFDIYVSYLGLGQTFNDKARYQGELETKSKYQGVDLRYHLMEGSNVLWGPMIFFRGVSVGVGAHKSVQTVRFLQDDAPMDLNTVANQQLVWNGRNILDYSTNIDTYTVDVRTGVQLLYFLNLSVGTGLAINKGSAEFELKRVGPVVYDSDPMSGADYLLPDGTIYPGMTSEDIAAQMASLGDAVLSMVIKGNGRVPARVPYLRAGAELNIWALKVSVDGMMSKRAYGANVGLRMEF